MAAVWVWVAVGQGAVPVAEEAFRSSAVARVAAAAVVLPEAVAAVVLAILALLAGVGFRRLPVAIIVALIVALTLAALA